MDKIPQPKPKVKISVFVHNLPPRASAKEVRDFFANFSIIEDIILPKHLDKYNKRFGFLLVASLKEADQIIRKFNQTKFKGNALTLMHAKNNPQTQPAQKEAPKTTNDKKVKNPRFTSLNQELINKEKDLFTDKKEHVNHIVLRLSVEEDALEEMEASLITFSRGEVTAFSIRLAMHKENINHIKVKHLMPNKFLLTFPSV